MVFSARRLALHAIAAGLFCAVVLACLALIEAAIAWMQPITTAYRWDAASGYRLRPNLSFAFATSEFSTRIVTNADGLRDPPQRAGDQRPVVLILGDSFAFGHGVEQADTFAAGLQDRLGERARIVNSGHPGWDTVHELAWFRAEGVRYRPKVVVIGFVLNDVLGNSGEFRFSPTATGWLRHLPFPAIAATLEYLLTDPLFVLFRLGFDVPYGAIDHTECLRPDRCDQGWQATAAVLAELVTDIRAQGAEPLLVHLPTRPESEPAEPPRQSDHAARRLAAIAATLGIPSLTVGGLPAAAFFPRDGHWTPAGHRAATGALAPVVAAMLKDRP